MSRVLSAAAMFTLLWVPGTVPAAHGKDVKVCIATAVIRPAKAGDLKWDGVGKVDSHALADALQGFAGATGNPAAAAAAFAIPLLSGNSQPDPLLTIEIMQDGETTRRNLPAIANTSTPTWDASSGCTSVDPDRNIRIRLTFEDEDPWDESDDIGTVEIGKEEIKDALRARSIILIDTTPQSPLVLAVGVSAIAP